MSLRLTIEPNFLKALRSLPPDRADAAREALVRFAATPELPRLRFHPLKGRKNHFSITAGRSDRIVLRKEEPDRYAVLDVGPHDNVYRRFNRR